MKILLILDCQYDFLNENGKMPVCKEHSERLIGVINRLGKSGKFEKIVFVSKKFSKFDIIGNLFRRFAAINGTPGAEIDRRIEIKGDRYFDKWLPNAFHNKKLKEYIESISNLELFICGVYSDQCVKSTVCNGIKRKLKVNVFEDGIGSSNKKRHEDAVKTMSKYGAKILNSKEYL